MEHLLSERIKSTPPSFIRSILKTAADPQIISFAGGLPNPVSFPQEELLVSMERIVRDYGSIQGPVKHRGRSDCGEAQLSWGHTGIFPISAGILSG